ncbi:MAG: anti-sigma factor domain-containing protein [Opitutaceae bacterium]
MIPEDLRDTIPLYVLGELDEAGRATFEVQLSRSAELQQEVRNCADSFAALAHDPNAPRELPAHIWAGIEQRVASPDAAAPLEGVAPVDGARIVWWRFAWPVAAALLFAINLAQWFWPRAPHENGEAGPREVAGRSGDRQLQADSGAGDSRGPASADGRSGISTTPAIAGRAPGIPAGTVDELTESRARAQRLAADYRKLAGEYDELARTVLPLVNSALLDAQPPAVWTAELRARGEGTGVSIGLWDRARELVPETGLALLPDRWGLSAGGAENSPGLGITNEPYLDAERVDVAPFAMAALNTEQGLGYLDLYNLPLLPPGGNMQLWLQNEGETGYSSIGAVPPVLAGGSGGLVFRIPQGVGETGRILITIEQGNTPAQPTGPVVIEGP